MGLLGNVIRSLLPLVPRAIVERVAARYVAGNSLASALDTVRALNAEGASATIDILGESVHDKAKADAAVDAYFELIAAVRDSGIDSSVSVKPTMLGLSISEAMFREQMFELAEHAQQCRVVVTIDMEDHTTTDATLRVFRELRESYPNVGCVLQAYLRRTLDDIRALPPQSNVRLCKGIYVEPEELAYKKYQEVRDAFLAALDQLLAAGHYAGIATHDEWLIANVPQLLATHAVARDSYEFQMLLGVKPALRRRLIAEGHKLRVYVPYGADWYPYSLRRLRENPQVAVHVLRAMLTGK